jgi:SAM-dependent methyltransferase
MEKLLIQNGVSVVGDSADLEKESFDILIAYEVLEHILNPKLFLTTYSELLKPGGLFIISTPNAHSLEVQQLKGNSTTLDIEHISVLTPAAIHSLAGACNFKVLRVETPGEFDLEMIAQAKSSGNTEGKSGIPISNQISQDQIKEFGFSSHMKVVLRKST